MSDRLQELRRQRTLIQQHLAWLDREIAAASDQPVVAPPATAPIPDPVASVAPAVVAPVVAAPAVAPIPVVAPAIPAEPIAPEVAAAADAILDEYRVAPDALQTGVKKGCYLYLLAAFGLLALGVIGLYYALRHD
jgi:hypothetical protein